MQIDAVIESLTIIEGAVRRMKKRGELSLMSELELIAISNQVGHLQALANKQKATLRK